MVDDSDVTVFDSVLTDAASTLLACVLDACVSEIISLISTDDAAPDVNCGLKPDPLSIVTL